MLHVKRGEGRADPTVAPTGLEILLTVESSRDRLCCRRADDIPRTYTFVVP